VHTSHNLNEHRSGADHVDRALGRRLSRRRLLGRMAQGSAVLAAAASGLFSFSAFGHVIGTTVKDAAACGYCPYGCTSECTLSWCRCDAWNVTLGYYQICNRPSAALGKRCIAFILPGSWGTWECPCGSYTCTLGDS